MVIAHHFPISTDWKCFFSTLMHAIVTLAVDIDKLDTKRKWSAVPFVPICVCVGPVWTVMVIVMDDRWWGGFVWYHECVAPYGKFFSIEYRNKVDAMAMTRTQHAYCMEMVWLMCFPRQIQKYSSHGTEFNESTETSKRS